MIQTLEMGKNIKDSRNEIERCAAYAEYHAKNAKEFLEDVKVESKEGFVSRTFAYI
jgi:acyl-CoA reductase-like NAD-dependent aldehyde dehydrogenase